MMRGLIWWCNRWVLNPMFPTVTKLIEVDVDGNLADKIHGR